jgi:GNAT superfamily N-acetyltransferase
MRRDAGPPLWGLDAAAIRFLGAHETRAHALGGRTMRDLGDAVLLFDPGDRDPFFNRLVSIRWPDDGPAFEARLGEAIALFAGLDRRPHIWTSPAFDRPADLGARLVGRGFADAGGAYVMLLVREPPMVPVPRGVRVERLGGGPGVTVPEATLRGIARVLVDSFGLDRDLLDAVAAETADAFGSPDFHVCLARDGGAPVAVAKRYTFDGASYLSSIGTVPGQRGRGLGLLVTDAAIRDALEASSRYVYLGVNAHNDRAIDVYRRAGMEILGGRAGDLVLAG